MSALERFKEAQGALKLLRQQRKDTKLKIRGLRKRNLDLEKARALVRTAAQQVQSSLQYQISELSTLALAAVFEDNPYQLKLDFVERRNRTEVDILFERDGQAPVSPVEAAGGGAVDVASFALRVSLLVLSLDSGRSTLVLDEPFQNLSRDLIQKASQIVKDISERLNIQMIVVTHDPSFTEYADRVFEVEKVKDISEVYEWEIVEGEDDSSSEV